MNESPIAAIRNASAFSPAGTNADFVEALPSGGARMRTYERGVEAESGACGTGALAAGIALAERRGVKLPVSIHVSSGDVLLVDADDMLLLTSLASDQALRTAQIVGAMGVVVHNDKPLPATMQDVARRLGISLVTAPYAKYESCVRIHAAIERDKRGETL